jgi:hypothetical protein
MHGHLNQAIHNLKFISDTTESYPDYYFDWKVTACFYTAVHLLRAFCEKRGVDPGDTHGGIANSFDPKKCGKRPITQCPPFLWNNYHKLKTYSEHARYEVFLKHEVENEIQRDNFKECSKLLYELRTYFETQGVSTILPISATGS